MAGAVKLRDDFSGDELRRLAGKAKDGAQARRLMALAAVRDGKRRGEAAAIGLMDRQTLRDWVHRFNEEGHDGLINRKSLGSPCKLSGSQKQELALIVEEDPGKYIPGLVRWRRIDLAQVVQQRFGVELHETTIGTILKQLGFSHVSARPRHPKQDPEVIEAYKKTSPVRYSKP